MFDLVFKNIVKHKVQAGSIVLLIATGTMLMFALALYSIGAYQGITLAEEQSGADVMLVSEEAASEVSDSALLFTGVPYHEYMDVSVSERAAGIAGVSRVNNQFFAETLAMPCCSVDTQTRIVGVDFSTDWTIQSLTSVDLQNGLGDDEVLVGSRVAGNPDGTITLHNERYKIVDWLPPTGSDIDLCVVADIDTVRKYAANLSGYDHYWSEYGEPDSLVSAVLIDLDDDLSEDQQKVTLRLLQKISGTKSIVRSQTMQAAEESLRVLLDVMLLAAIAVVVVALIQLFSRFYSMAWDRRAEFTIYRLVGATRKKLAFLVVGEALILSGVGTVVGLIGGYILYATGDAWLLSGGSFPFVPPTLLIIAITVLAVIVLWAAFTFLSVLAPLRQISKISPALAMRQNDIV